MTDITKNGPHPREIIAARWPLCFAARGQPKRPLKIGIKNDMKAAAPDLKTKIIHVGLFNYCQGPKYHEAFVAGAQRVDLLGNDAGAVTSDDVALMQMRATGMRHENAIFKALREAGITVAALEAGVIKDLLAALELAGMSFRALAIAHAEAEMPQIAATARKYETEVIDAIEKATGKRPEWSAR